MDPPQWHSQIRDSPDFYISPKMVLLMCHWLIQLFCLLLSLDFRPLLRLEERSLLIDFRRALIVVTITVVSPGKACFFVCLSFNYYIFNWSSGFLRWDVWHVLMCIYVFACVCMYVRLPGIHIYVHECGGQRLMLRVFITWFPFYSLKAVSDLNLELTDSDSLAC